MFENGRYCPILHHYHVDFSVICSNRLMAINCLLIATFSECLIRAAGKYRQEGKTYVVQDGDIIFFKFNVSGGGKK
uniref:YchF C-terminal domain-containing protein n=1 Tax=Kalanchoe fedtschenkoi TaxID=63787 RepID=A0A7N1A8T0_KALFE